MEFSKNVILQFFKNTFERPFCFCIPEATSETSAWVNTGLINKSNDLFLPVVTKPEEDQVYDVTATGNGEFHKAKTDRHLWKELF